MKRLDILHITISGSIDGKYLSSHGRKCNFSGSRPFRSTDKGFLKGNSTHRSMTMTHNSVKYPPFTISNRLQNRFMPLGSTFGKRSGEYRHILGGTTQTDHIALPSP